VSRSNWLFLPVGDQGHEIGFESLPVLRRVAQQQLDQPSLASTKMPMHAAARETVQEAHGLLSEQTFEFVSGHFKNPVMDECEE
jgi:hypothetical protein